MYLHTRYKVSEGAKEEAQAKGNSELKVQVLRG